MSHADRPLLCRECGSSFNFSAGEQTFYASRGLQHEPARCPGCRAARKGTSNCDGSLLNGNYVHYGPFASFGGRTPRQMHPAVCAQCSQMTEVPFVPRGEKPVLCSECYAASRRASAGARGQRR